MQISHRSAEPFQHKPYEGPRHIPEGLKPKPAEEYWQGDWTEPAIGPGYIPGKKVLKETGFVTVQGFTGWIRRDEARSIGYTFIGGERRPAPNFQKIAAWGRITGERPNDDWELIDDFAFKQEVTVAAPRNDAEFRELAAMFDRAYVAKVAE